MEPLMTQYCQKYPQHKDQIRRHGPLHTPGNTAEQWSSKQCGTDTKTDLWINGTEEREPSSKPTHLQSINLAQRKQGYAMRKKQSA